MAPKPVLTTWEAGRYCGVSPYTVRYWVRTGRLPAYTTPGGHRRIRRQDLDAFLVAHKMPLPSNLQAGTKRILMLLASGEKLAKQVQAWSDALEAKVTCDAFQAGVALAAWDPHLFLVDLDSEAWDGMAVCRAARRTQETVHVQVATLSRSTSVEAAEELQRDGVLASLSAPLDPPELRRLLRDLFPYISWTRKS